MSVPEEQMMAEMAQEAPPVSNEPELVGGVPAEQLPPEVTVADDVPRDVEEGAFVINAPAAEYMGYNDLAEMLLNAMKKARELGLDKPESGGSISDEEIVNLVVSKGEVLIPPHLARIIGYDTLNKINARGEREVQRRQEVAAQEQAPQEEAPVAGAEAQMEQLVAQQAQQPGPAEPQMMALGGEAEDTRKGYMDLATSPLVNRDRINQIQEFAENSTQEIRKAYGTKALAIDNELDAHRHLLGAALLYKEFLPNVADTMLDLNEVSGIVGDYLGSSGPGAVSSEKSRNMDYHNNDVARYLVSQIPANKLSQMDDTAMKLYVRKYFDEVRAAMQDGSIEAIDPRLVPMFNPEGNEAYEPLKPAINTTSVYITGPDGNHMENPNHPGVKARQERQGRAEGTKSYDGEKNFLMPRKEDIPSGDPRGESRSITQGMLEKGVIGDADITPKDALPPSMPMEIERMEPSTNGIVKPEHRDLPKVLTGEQFLQMKKQVVGYISNNEVSDEELDNMLSMMRGMTSDEEYMRSIEIERGDPIVGDTPIMGLYPQDHFYDEEDTSRILDYNDRRDEVIESI